MSPLQLSRSCSLFFPQGGLENSERFGTEELARIEGDIEAREKSAIWNIRFWCGFVKKLRYIQRSQQLAQAIMTVDALQSYQCRRVNS